MSYLNNNQYNRRKENAAQRNLSSEEIAKKKRMTEEQASAISSLCEARHEFHSNIDKMIDGNDDSFEKSLIDANISINESGLDPMNFIPSYDDDCIDIDNISLLESIGESPANGTDEYDEWYSSEYDRIYSEWEKINSKIEKYLSAIDKKYKTHFCPTGNLRIF